MGTLPSTTLGAFEHTLEDVLIERVAEHYRELLDCFRKIVRKQLEKRDSEVLRNNARASWQQTLQHLAGTRRQPKLIEHIIQSILPLLEEDDLSQTLFLIMFFADERAKLKRAWCPTDVTVLKTLGFPYSAINPITKGLPGIPSLARWAVPLTRDEGPGLSGGFQHQLRHDLSVLQYAKQTYNPEGDWFVGIKSSLFLGVPVLEKDPQKRIGQISICSPVPDLFGSKDVLEGSRRGKQFFGPYLKSVPEVKDIRRFCDLFQDCVSYRQTGASQLAYAWMFQTVGLTHKNRAEAELVDLQWSLPIETFLRFIEDKPEANALLQEYNRQNPGYATTAKGLLDNISHIRSNVRGQLRFYEFLRHYSYLCQQKLGIRVDDKLASSKAEAKRDRNRSISYQSFDSFRDHISAITALMPPGGTQPKMIDWKTCEEWNPIGPFLEKGAVEYIFYELLNNALEHAPAAGTVRCSARTLMDAVKRHTLRFSVSNEIALTIDTVFPKSFPCDKCQRARKKRLHFKGRWLCSHCVPGEAIAFFNTGECWWPQTSGRFGLFMIRQYVKEFYDGELTAGARRCGPNIEVTFALELPMEDRGSAEGESAQ